MTSECTSDASVVLNPKTAHESRPDGRPCPPTIAVVTRTCVFCGASPLTREHVYPRWLASVLPEQERWRGQDMVVVAGDQITAADLPKTTREIPEIFTETTVARVCRRCNNGWMNDLEGAVRSALTMLIQGNNGHVTVADSDALAMWVAKTVMMAEFTHPESAATPTDHYDWLFRRRTPPPGMNIWVLPTETDDWALRMEHTAVLFGEPATTKMDGPCNTHSTILGLGRVAFCVMATTNQSLVLPSLDDLPLGARRLWPELTSFCWDRASPLDSDDLWFVNDLLRLWIGDDDDLFTTRLIDLGLRRAASSQ
jgi:hypothetical protein